MTLQTGDVVLIRMPFHQVPGLKVRPALVLLDTGDDDFIAAPLTSRAWSSEFDYPLRDWQAAGLNVASTGRIHKLTVLAKAEVVRKLGSCSEEDQVQVRSLFCQAFCQR
ncbi:MAG: type II toxin-antitoxin system PemK/MazF family toxin [Bryobacter sp.]|nr:type II toxin-antitoxin system PemK/MazF family toxin [Bryobacter sp.]